MIAAQRTRMASAGRAAGAAPGTAKRALITPTHPTWRRLVVLCMAAKVWRPTIDDVDSISRGGPAKVRGTGSRRIPHRLNAEERTLYDMAKKKGFVAVRGTGYRKFRHGNPLPNIYRQWCDAKGQLCVVVEQDPIGAGGTDRVVVDLAPLRLLGDTAAVVALLRDLAAEAGVRQVGYDERPLDALPFNILPADVDGADDDDHDDVHGADADADSDADPASAVAAAVAAAATAGLRGGGSGGCGDDSGHSGSSAGSSGGSSGSGSSGGGADARSGSGPQPEVLAGLRRMVEAQAAVVRQLKEVEGRGNQDPAVREQVQELLRLKADLQRAEAASAPPGASLPSHQAAGTATTQHQQPSPRQAPQQHAHPPRTDPPAERVGAASASAPDAGQPAAGADASTGEQRAEAIGGPSSSPPPPAPPQRSPLQHYYSLPIWRIHAVPLFFEGERAGVKRFASEAVKRVAEGVKTAVAGR